MAIAPRLKELLDREGVRYRESHHDKAVFTAQEVAGEEHVPGKRFVKTVIVRLMGRNEYLMCVLSANHLVDFSRLEEATGVRGLELANEGEMKELFPEYDVGAIPPFGHLRGLPVYADRHLEGAEEIAFSAGTHTDIVIISRQDFLRLAKPTMADFGVHV